MTEQDIEALVQKYADGTATAEEVQQLMEWYRAAPMSPVIWPAAETAVREKVQRRLFRGVRDTRSIKRGRRLWLTPLRAAAVLLVVSAAAALFYFRPSTPTAYVTITSPSGQTRQVELPDGSTVWLNAATTLKYTTAFTQHRRLQLDGEALFDVTPDATHPFSVASGGVQVTVLGTRFTIAGYATAAG